LISGLVPTGTSFLKREPTSFRHHILFHNDHTIFLLQYIAVGEQTTAYFSFPTANKHGSPSSNNETEMEPPRLTDGSASKECLERTDTVCFFLSICLCRFIRGLMPSHGCFVVDAIHF
jgi:hypothetical protein